MPKSCSCGRVAVADFDTFPLTVVVDGAAHRQWAMCDPPIAVQPSGAKLDRKDRDGDR